MSKRLLAFLKTIAVLLQGLVFLHSHDAAAADVSRVTFQKGIYSFQSPDVEGFCAAERANCSTNKNHGASHDFFARYSAAVCAPRNKTRCVCDADVNYPLVRSVSGAAEINEVLRKIAGQYACNSRTSVTKLDYSVTQNVDKVLSVIFSGYNFPTGGGGSCHSDTLALTADVETGHVYTLSEFLQVDQRPGIKSSIIAYFETYFLSSDLNDTDRREHLRLLSDNLDKSLMSYGFYVRDRQLFVNLNQYILGCSEGPSFAIPIPRKFIRSDMLSLLE